MTNLNLEWHPSTAYSVFECINDTNITKTKGNAVKALSSVWLVIKGFIDTDRTPSEWLSTPNSNAFVAIA